jgi:hypothetical protein
LFETEPVWETEETALKLIEVNREPFNGGTGSLMK